MMMMMGVKTTERQAHIHPGDGDDVEPKHGDDGIVMMLFLMM